MNALPQRVVSALVAAALLIGSIYFFGRQGLTVLGVVIFSIGAYEYSQIAFTNHLQPKNARSFKLLFLFFALTLLFVNVLSIYVFADPRVGSPALLTIWGVAITFFVSCTLWLLRGRIENAPLLAAVATAVLGFFYCSLLPYFMVRILYAENGIAWFSILAMVVFAGDTFAYFGGIWLGKNKLMPSLSPSKTVAGSVSGLIGSALAGLWVGSVWISTVPIFYLIIAAVFAAFLAQNGDLFESLIKRVGNVKDSGRIMPGHGGVLDRLDGLYFAAPAIFAAVLFCQ